MHNMPFLKAAIQYNVNTIKNNPKKSLKSKCHKALFGIVASPTFKQKIQTTYSLLIFNLTLNTACHCSITGIISTSISVKSYIKTKNIKEHQTALIAV